MNDVDRLRQDLAYVLKSMQEHPHEWESSGFTNDAKPYVDDLFNLAESIEEGPAQ